MSIQPYKFPYGKTTFKGVQIETGDVVVFRTPRVPLPEVQAAVMGVEENGQLSVLSTLLAPFQDNGLFSEDEINGLLTVVYPAEIAIPQESRGKSFKKGEGVTTTIGNQRFTGKVVAAFDGLVVALTSDGQSFTGGASFFSQA